MTTSTVTYIGALQTTCMHANSGYQITTDAPTDNHGKGAYFSPTDLCATALATCAITTMGIKANLENKFLGDVKAEVYKVMANNPRRISEIRIDFTFSDAYTEAQKEWLMAIAHNCPVAKSLHPDIKQVFSFAWA